MSTAQSEPTKGRRVFVTGIGLISAAGLGEVPHRRVLREGDRCLGPLSLFSVPGTPLPVGQVTAEPSTGDLPRTHRLALAAAREALADGPRPDAIILGVTTGGMPRTETLLRDSDRDPQSYALHGTGTVATHLARELGCSGPALTVSTACSSGAVALKIAREMLLAGEATRVLAGGVDALCRLTYHGFRMLQLVAPKGTRPLDEAREGMTVGEGAALLVLTADSVIPEDARAELLGGGLSCDAHHPSAPHPDGAGALEAMRGALEDAGLKPSDIGYVNLHGTGTRDNDVSEARAIRSLFPNDRPPLSSTKGAFGHPLAAAGALEAALAVLCLEDGILPGNVGCASPDPALQLTPILKPRSEEPGIILSNSFGFGGNNAALILGRPDAPRQPGRGAYVRRPLHVLGIACLTGAGHTEETMERLVLGQRVVGLPTLDVVTKDLPPRSLRRMKRLTKITLALGTAALRDAEDEIEPHGVFLGTGWGPLSETSDFLERLYRSDEEFSSPTDFVGSVHNAMASQLAIRFKARGPNITATNGDSSFEETAYLASLLAPECPFLLCGADERHELLSPLIDRSVRMTPTESDGGGALLARAAQAGDPGPFLVPHRPQRAGDDPGPLIQDLGGRARIRGRFAAIFVNLPAACRERGQAILERFLDMTGFDGPVLLQRDLLGEYSTASAAATVLAVHFIREGSIPEALIGSAACDLDSSGILLLGFGETWTAMELLP